MRGLTGMATKLGIYLRLSDEDENREESNSITGQRDLILAYIHQQKDLANNEILEFCDDGYSGTNFQRPGIKKLLLEARKQQISCIIVKDFSRFGRNYLEVGRYLEEIFPLWGIRFISVNDYFDSNNVSCKNEFMNTVFKNLVYDLFSKDLSQKITSVKQLKAEEGQLMAAFAPYGYLKSKEKGLFLDEVAAPIVKRIFSMALEGIPKVEIARILNFERVPSPYMLKKKREEKFSCFQVQEAYLWRPATISKILKDQRYVGDGVYGKKTPTRVGSRQEKAIPIKDWIIVPNTHEAIVSREIFEKANAKFKNYLVREKKKECPLSKKIKCGACNHMISRKVSSSKKTGRQSATYRCATLELTSEFGCCKKRRKEEEIEKAVWNYMMWLVKCVYDEELERFFGVLLEENIRTSERVLKQKRVARKKLTVEKARLYEEFRKQEWSKKEYIDRKRNWEVRCEQVEEGVILVAKTIENLRGFLENKSAGSLIEFCLGHCLTRELVDTMVEGITIERDGTVKIYWKLQDIFVR